MGYQVVAIFLLISSFIICLNTDKSHLSLSTLSKQLACSSKPGYPFKNPSLHTNLNIERRDETMSYLLDRERNNWDFNSLFNPRVVAKIMKITFSSTLRADGWLWTEERSKIFNVKSVYQLIKNLQNEERGEFKCQPICTLLEKDMVGENFS